MLGSRTRYLLAMGLVPTGVAACNRESPPAVVTAPGDAATAAPEAGTPPATASATVTVDAADAATGAAATDAAAASATPNPFANVRRTDAGAGTWQVAPIATAPPSPSAFAEPPRATCPSGYFCTTSPHAGPRAEAPFAACARRVPGPRTPDASFNAMLTEAERASTPDACCYSWFIPCPGGRPLRVDDQVFLAPPSPREDWSEGVALAEAALDAATRAALASYWRAQGAAEHASIASFNRFALQLLALGAPSALVGATLDAARDEIAHARLCFGLAAAYDGRSEGPGALPLPAGATPTDPRTIARETLRDGCLGEAVAAELARVASTAAADPAVAAVLARTADDEERHAALAWRAVAWLAREHGALVAGEIEAFVAELHAELSGAAPAAEPDDLERHGALGPARQLAWRRAVVRDVVVPCAEALATLATGALNRPPRARTAPAEDRP